MAAPSAYLSKANYHIAIVIMLLSPDSPCIGLTMQPRRRQTLSRCKPCCSIRQRRMGPTCSIPQMGRDGQRHAHATWHAQGKTHRQLCGNSANEIVLIALPWSTCIFSSSFSFFNCPAEHLTRSARALDKQQVRHPTYSEHNTPFDLLVAAIVQLEPTPAAEANVVH